MAPAMSCSSCRHQLVHDPGRGVAVCSNCGATYDESVLFEEMPDDGPDNSFAASVAAADAGGGARADPADVSGGRRKKRGLYVDIIGQWGAANCPRPRIVEREKELLDFFLDRRT